MPEEHSTPDDGAHRGEHAEPERSIRRAIGERGAISFAEFMELALYGPGGFYEDPPVGPHRHFVTSPHLHPVFGRLLGAAVGQLAGTLDGDEPATIVEVGAGDGTLAGQLRTALADLPHRYVAVERSTGARRMLLSLRPPPEVAASIEALDQHVEGIVLANELLDNLPFRWVRRDDRGDLQEVLVDVRDDRLVPAERPFPEADTEALAAVPEPLGPGADGVIPEGALHFVERLARVLQRGYALLIDYGAAPGAQIHGYRDQRVVDDVLDRPGSTDITAGVDFRVLQERAEALGLRSFEPVTQRSALLALGYGAWAERERGRQAEALDRRSGREAVVAWSSRNSAAELVDPEGLGRLRWWVVATAGLPEPEWLHQAGRRDIEAIAVAGSEGVEGFLTFTDVRVRWWQLRHRWRARRAN